MSRSTGPDTIQILTSEAIRNTTTVNSAEHEIGDFSAESIVVHNGLNQSVDCQLQGSVDKTNWIDIGAVFNIPSITNDYETVSDYFPCMRVQVTATSSPTTGTIDVYIVKV